MTVPTRFVQVVVWSSVLMIAAVPCGATSVIVGAGQTIGAMDFRAGMFAGQSFVLGPKTTFEINAGGAVAPIFDAPEFDFFGSTINMNIGAPESVFGNAVLNNLELNVFSEGGVGFGLKAGMGTTVNLRGGRLAGIGQILSGGTLNLFEGGNTDFVAAYGGTINLAGGLLGSVIAGGGSRLNLMSGVHDAGIQAFDGTRVDVIGDSMVARLVVFRGASLNLHAGTVATGSAVSLGGTANIWGGFVSEDFGLFESSVCNIYGGAIGERLKAERNSIINLFGGSIATDGSMRDGSILNIAGGTINGDFRADEGTTVNITAGTVEGLTSWGGQVFISGGRVDRLFSGLASGEVHISGGEVTNSVEIAYGSTLYLSGGTFSAGLRMDNNSFADLLVTGASLNGVPIELRPGVPWSVNQRDGELLEVTLADGSEVDFVLSTRFYDDPDFFSHTAVLTLTRVPTPGGAVLLFSAAAFVACSRRRRVG